MRNSASNCTLHHFYLNCYTRSMDFVFILAGGRGTRLWPASDSARPKQFIPLIDGKSLFQLSVERAAALKPKCGIIVISLAEQAHLVSEDFAACNTPDVPVLMIPEPFGRNTAPAITAAVLYAEKLAGPEATVLVLTSDHLIGPQSAFASDCSRAEELSAAGYITTFGIRPDRPETGFGYIEAGEQAGPGRKVKKFHEKPDLDNAEKYFRSNDFFWNSGMFSFKISLFLDEVRRQAPDITEAFSPCSFSREHSDSGFSLILDNETFRECYRQMRSVSVDYAVMEKCLNTAVVEASFDWSDLGSWDEIAANIPDKLEKKLVVPENGSNFVYSDIPVSVQGLDNLIVVIKNGRCLICEKGSSQDVKLTVEELKKLKRDDLL